MQNKKNYENLKKIKNLMDHSGIRKKTFLQEKESTNSFVEGVIKRVNEMTKKSIEQEINLQIIKERINKNKNDQNLEVIELQEEICENNKIEKLEIFSDEDEIQIISEKQYLENVMQSYSKNELIKNSDCFSCLICYKARVIINTRVFKCGHEFCDKCAIKWSKISNTCPVCRKKF